MSSLIISGDTSGTVIIAAPAVAGSGTLTLPAVTDTLVGLAATQTLTNKTVTAPVLSGSVTGTYTLAGTPTMGASLITSGTAVASTSGTSIDFTGIPSWVKRITLMFNGVSTSATSNIQIQIGDSGGIESTSYVSTASTNGTSLASSSTGFIVAATTAAATTVNGWYGICLLGSNVWTGGGSLARADGNMNLAGGAKTLSDTLDRVRLTTVNGTDTFDLGSVNILYE